MDLELAKFLFQVLTFLMTGSIGIYVYLSNKDKVTNDRIGKLEDDLDLKLDGHAERIARLEAGPTHQHLSEMHNKINQVAGDMKELQGEFKATNRTLQLIHETLMERK
jgi:uncharacterized protein YjbJ (UPF0337 family)